MKRLVQLILSLAVSGVCIWFSLRNTQISAVWGSIVNASVVPILGYAMVLIVIHFVRTYRWGVLLEPLVKPRFRDLNPLSAVGFMALMVLPLRLGEFARPLLVAENLRVRRSAAMASVVVERLVDGLVMAMLFVALLYSIDGGENVMRYRYFGALVMLGWTAGLGVLIIGVWWHKLFVSLLHATIGRFSPRIAERIETMIDTFAVGVKALPSVGKAVEFFALTTVYWGLAGAGLWVMARAFPSLQDMTVMQAFTILGMQVIGAMIPAGPGMVGTFQAFTQWGVGFFHPNAGANPEIVAYANVIWFMQFMQQALFGLYFIAMGRVRPGAVFNFSPTTKTGEKDESKGDERVAVSGSGA